MSFSGHLFNCYVYAAFEKERAPWSDVFFIDHFKRFFVSTAIPLPEGGIVHIKKRSLILSELFFN